MLNNINSIQNKIINKFCLLKHEPNKLIKNKIKVKLNKNKNVTWFNKKWKLNKKKLMGINNIVQINE